VAGVFQFPSGGEYTDRSDGIDPPRSRLHAGCEMSTTTPTSAPIYLDNNATTRLLPEVVEAMAACWRDGFANPGSRHVFGRRARQALETARGATATDSE